MAVDVSGSGPIPADAGEPGFKTTGEVTKRAYPRGRGGAQQRPLWPGTVTGLSPRTRGSHRANCGTRAERGPIPADAGEPARSAVRRGRCRAYPRGRGGATCSAAARIIALGLSPRTRGSPNSAYSRNWETGPIPADAGEPEATSPNPYPLGAYPRGRGGAVCVVVLTFVVVGLSPRTRGSH